MLLAERNEIKINILVISNLSDNSFDSGSNPQTQYKSPEVFKSQVMVIRDRDFAYSRVPTIRNKKF